MPKVTVVQVIYNSKKFIEPVFSAIFSQTFKDFNVVAVIAGNQDGSKELLAQKFPQVEILDPGYNIGFANGHNLVFQKYSPEFFQLVNPDLIMEPNYIEELLKAFNNPAVGAASGKLLRYDFSTHLKTNIIDSTGVTISNSGRARDRGQHEEDNHQYDELPEADAVSGAGAMYRREALMAVKYKDEFFDSDFHSYWEDVDLSWRMSNAGFKNIFVPSAVAYHGRTAGSSKGGYRDVIGFIRHHKRFSSYVRQQNYKNHIFMYIKNSRWLYPQFFVREFFMFIYILIFETATLKILPQIIKNLPKIWQKRKYILSK